MVFLAEATYFLTPRRELAGDAIAQFQPTDKQSRFGNAWWDGRAVCDNQDGMRTGRMRLTKDPLTCSAFVKNPRSVLAVIWRMLTTRLLRSSPAPRSSEDSEADLIGVFSSLDGESDWLCGFERAQFHDTNESRFCTLAVRRSRIPRLNCVL
jgi:hypothetical protein